MPVRQVATPMRDEVDPKKIENHRQILDRAKARASVPRSPPALSGTPSFDQIPNEPADLRPGETKERLQQVRPETEAGLKAIAEASARIVPQTPPIPSPEGKVDGPEEEEVAEPTEDEKIHTAVLARTEPFNLGAYLATGEGTQVWHVIPGHLVITFRTCSDEEEVHVDRQLALEVQTVKIAERELIRRQGEWALACHIHSVNGQTWPAVLKQDGTVNDENMKERLKKVRRLPSAVFTRVAQSLNWFLEGVNEALTVAQLKNG